MEISFEELQKKADPYKLFLDSLKAPDTYRKYKNALGTFLKLIPGKFYEGVLNELPKCQDVGTLAKCFVELAKKDPAMANKIISAYIKNENELVSQGKLSANTLPNHVKPIKALLDSNGIPMHWKSLYKLYPRASPAADDRAYTREELQKLIEVSPDITDKIESIQINDVTLQSDSEEKIILDCVEMIKDIDPDYIITEKGDSWDFPFLAQRAAENNISDKLVLGREKNHTISKPKREGTSYFSYGQIHFKPTATKLLGRIHVDKSNCFLWTHEHSLQGIYEISRTCRLPLQTAARASIGKCMSSIQFYNATKRGLLIPWKPIVSEIFKSRIDLLIGDRGGLILEPRIGVHENVGEVDFASLFGNIMLKKNISAETIDCKCCPDSENIVPELGYHICKKQGIIPQSLKLLLDKRQRYTELIETTKDEKKIKIYKERKTALKWILVTSFGYLGFNNAKFGRIDAHMAVCAFARQLLLQAIKIAEKNQFKVLHGIVDSLWVYKKDATRNDYDDIRRQIADKTGFDLSLDVYNWIVFVSSKENKIVPVPNRYFGANQNSELKLRGIETRRHDTPEFFNSCQHEILNLLASCKNVSEIRQAIPKAKLIQEKYRKRLFEHKVPLEDLVFTNRVTRGTGEHKSNTIQADAVNQLKWAGRSIVPGQKIRYVIRDYSRKISKRVVPIEIAESKKYDVKRYSELLDECCKSIIEPFEN